MSEENKRQFGLKSLLVALTLVALVAGALHNGVPYEFFLAAAFITGLVSVPITGIVLLIWPAKAKYPLNVAVLGISIPVYGAAIYVLIHESWELVTWLLKG